MAYEDIYKSENKAHRVELDGRNRLTVTGVEDVDSFDEETVVMYTSCGLLTVLGSELRIERLTTDGGELSVEGHIDCLQYEDMREKGGFWRRVFK